VRALVTDRQREGTVFVPIHWTDRFASSARIDALVAPETDPISGQPESKATTVAVAPYAAAWYGFAVTRSVPATIPADYWARARIQGGERLELAGLDAPADWTVVAETLFGAGATLASIADPRAGRLRLAAIRDGEVVGLLLVAPTPVEASRDWLVERFEAGPIPAAASAPATASASTRSAPPSPTAAPASRRSARRPGPAPTVAPAGPRSPAFSPTNAASSPRRRNDATPTRHQPPGLAPTPPPAHDAARHRRGEPWPTHPSPSW
jgi:hypothetical protein